MKLRLFLLGVLCVIPSLCIGDSIPFPGDARMQSGQSSGSIPIHNLNFTFTLVIGNNPNVEVISPTFSNLTGGTIFKETVTPQFGAYTTGNVPNTCGFVSVYFTNCTAPAGNNGNWTFFGLPGVPQHSPITFGGEFDFGVFGFNPGEWTFDVQLSDVPPVPEPSTLLLIAPALAGLWIKRKTFLS